MKRKILSILLALVLVLSFSLVLAVPVSANTGGIKLVATGDSTATWTAEEKYAGDYSVKLAMPEGSWGDSKAEVQISIADKPKIGNIDSWSFWTISPQQTSMATPIEFNVDTTGDGKIDTIIPGTTTGMPPEGWSEETQNTISCYHFYDPATNLMVWLSTWADVRNAYGEATLLRVDLGYGPLGGMGAATAYVDDFTLTVGGDTTIYELEPPSDDTEVGVKVAGVTSVSPATGDIDTTLEVVITGSGFKAEGDATGVDFGEGIDVTFNVNTDTQITAQLSIDATAAAGARDVTVTVPDVGDIIGSGLFTVLQSLTLRAPSNISLGLMVPGATATGQSAGTVVTNASTWSVTAIDEKVSNTGFMVTAGGDKLDGLFQISGNESTYVNALDGLTYNQAYGKSLPFFVKQAVATDDPIGSYTITITFTGTY